MSEQKPFTVAGFKQWINEKQLMASYSPASDTLYLPPHAICPQTHDDHMEWRALSGSGRLVAFTSVYIAPTFMIEQGYGREAPYCTGIVELDEGVRISARILGVDATHPETIQIGTPVTVEFLDQPDGQVALAFRA